MLNGWLIIETENRMIDKIPIEDGWQTDGAYGMLELLIPREANLRSKVANEIHDAVHAICRELLQQLSAGKPVALCNEFAATILPFSE